MEYPKYLIIYADQLVPNADSLRYPLTLYEFDAAINLAECLPKGHNFGEIIYNLVGIVSHEKTRHYDPSKYTAVVKKRMDGHKEKQWLAFDKDEMKHISEEEALTKYPA